MVKFLGINLPNKKKIYLGLTTIFVIGISKALNLLKKLNIDSNLKVAELNDLQIAQIRNFLETAPFKLEGDLKREIKLNIQHLIAINCYRGKRHLKALPVRGQRTRTNSRTVRKLKIVNIKK